MTAHSWKKFPGVNFSINFVLQSTLLSAILIPEMRRTR
jgi:hypothetical protein